MSAARIQRIATHRLANGGQAFITKLGVGWDHLGWEGREYQFSIYYNPDTGRNDDLRFRLSKAEAYELLADAIKNDVMEVE
jgi:hypothetical protein